VAGGTCLCHLSHPGGNAEEFSGIVEKPDVLNRLIDCAHLSGSQSDLRREVSSWLAAKVLRKHAVERIKPLSRAAGKLYRWRGTRSEFKSKTEIACLSRGEITIGA
jgi:hypothetical protein